MGIFMAKSLKNVLDLYTCWSPILSFPTWILVGMATVGIFDIKYVLIPTYIVWVLTWFFIAVYFQSYSSLSESFDKKLGVGLTVYNTVGLVVLVYLLIAYNGVLLEAMTPPIWK